VSGGPVIKTHGQTYRVTPKGWVPQDDVTVAALDAADTRRTAWSDSLRDREHKGSGESEIATGLGLRSAAELAADVEHEGPRKFLVEGIIVAGQHGVAGDVPKAGKGFDVVDLAVSVASGTRFLGRFACEQGSVVLFAAEEDEHELARRLDAVGTAKGIDYRALPIHVGFRVPRLGHDTDMRSLSTALEDHRPALTLVDPMYRAADGADGRSLYGMAEILDRLERTTRDIGSALYVSSHYNRDTSKRGAARFTGAGPQEWGRFLIASEVTNRSRTPEGGSRVVRRMEVTGSSIPGSAFVVTRTIYALVPDDPASPLAYDTEVTDVSETDTGDDLTFTQRRVLGALLGSDRARTNKEIGDHLAADGRGKPLMRNTISEALNALGKAGLADADATVGTAKAWWRP
jgi:hypothetical protein